MNKTRQYRGKRWDQIEVNQRVGQSFLPTHPDPLFGSLETTASRPLAQWDMTSKDEVKCVALDAVVVMIFCVMFSQHPASDPFPDGLSWQQCGGMQEFSVLAIVYG